MSGIEGGGGQFIDPSLYENTEGVVEEYGAEIADKAGVDPAKKLAKQLTKDTLQASEKVSESLSLNEFEEFADDAGVPTLPLGEADKAIGDILKKASSGEVGEVAQKMTSELPKELQVALAGAGSNPDLLGIGDTINQIAGANLLATDFMDGIEGLNMSNPLDGVIPTMDPGAINPLSSPGQQNAQMAANKLEVLNNQLAMGQEILAGMPEGPDKDSLAAYLSNIEEAISELEESIGQMQEADAKKKKDVTKGDDQNQIREKKKAEAEKEASEGGGLLGGLTDMLGPIGDLLSPLTDLLGGFTDMLSLDALGGLLEPLTDLLDLGGLGEMFGGTEGMIFALGGAVLFAALTPLALPFSLILGAAAGLLLASMVGGEDNFLSSMLKELPIVGDLFTMVMDTVGGFFEMLSLDGLLGGGGSEGSKSESSSTSEKSRSRNAGTAAASADVGASAAGHAAELDGAAEEEAEMKAQLSKLLSMLRSIASGNASPEQLAGSLTSTLGELGKGDLEGLVGPEAASQFQAAAEMGMSGDAVGMADTATSAFGVTPEQMATHSGTIADLIPDTGTQDMGDLNMGLLGAA